MSQTHLHDGDKRAGEGAGEPPLCADLDGTLIATNLLMEAALSVFRRNPLMIFLLPFWLARGKAYLWNRVGPGAVIDVKTLPYRPEVLRFLQIEHNRGRHLILVTGTHEALARKLRDHLGFFSGMMATEGDVHLVSRRKADLLRATYGARLFDYVGDSADDLAVWDHCGTAWLVNAPARVGQTLTNRQIAWRQIPLTESVKPRFQAFLEGLRWHQWAKNLLLFVPIFLAHRWKDTASFPNALLAFAAFCAASSAMYLVNDLVDLEADRHHSKKRNRPIAAGHLPIPDAALLSVGLFVLALSAGALVSWEVMAMVLGYVTMTLSYSFWLKRVLILDVVLLAGLHCYRILVGGAATGISISPWTLGFSLFLFVSLALMKRYSELDRLPALDDSAPRRGYRASDKTQVSHLGTASGMLSILVIALYVNSPEIRGVYRSPNLLWFMCPIILVWIGRLWIIAGRGEMDEDPVQYALSDWWSIILGIMAALVVVVAASV